MYFLNKLHSNLVHKQVYYAVKGKKDLTRFFLLNLPIQFNISIYEVLPPPSLPSPALQVLHSQNIIGVKYKIYQSKQLRSRVSRVEVVVTK